MNVGAAEVYEDEGYDKDAVSPATRCYVCGGFGYMASVCPKEKGEGAWKSGWKVKW